MNRVFELYDCNDTVSYHKTLEGALKAMSEAILRETPGLVNAFEGDDKINLDLRYYIDSIELKD